MAGGLLLLSSCDVTFYNRVFCGWTPARILHHWNQPMEAIVTRWFGQFVT